MGAGERPHGKEPAVLAGCTKSSGRREKMLSPFPRRPDFAHDQASEPNEKASGKAGLYGVRASWPRLRTAPRRGWGKERADASDAHGRVPGGGAEGGRRGEGRAAKPGRRPGEPKGLSWGGGPSEAGAAGPPSTRFAEQTPQAQALLARLRAEAARPAEQTRRGRGPLRGCGAPGGDAPRRVPGGSQSRKKAAGRDGQGFMGERPRLVAELGAEARVSSDQRPRKL